MSKGTAQKPRLIVFDLDYTLWPFWVDTHVDPPFRRDSTGKVFDRRSREIKVYNDVPKILADLHASDCLLGIASRTTCTKEALSLVNLFNWDKYFHFKEIYPGDKCSHFQKFHSSSKVPFSEMLFFDDEERNIKSVSTLGVTCIHVPDGMSSEILSKGLQQFAANQIINTNPPKS